MNIQDSLYIGEWIVFTAIDPETDAQVEAQWTQDPYYLRMLSPKPALPLSADQVRRAYEKIEKDAEESKNLFHFAIRLKRSAEKTQPATGLEQLSSPFAYRLIGFVQLHWIEWNHGAGFVKIGIGAADERGKGYGTEALRLALRYAFAELNLYRLSAIIPQYNEPALRLFRKAGFVEEVRRRKALNRDGKVWDLLHLGILSEEWKEGVKRNG